jgi:putative membrane protein
VSGRARRRARTPLTEVGTDPDPRFSYANERTFLAWNRTSLALIAAGLAVTTLLPEFEFEHGRRLIGVPLIALGAVLAFASYRRWQDNERAMRLGEPLPPSRLPVILAIGIGVAAALAAVVALFGGAE